MTKQVIIETHALHLEPGDVVVLRFPEGVEADAALVNLTMAIAQERFPNHKVLALAHGMDITTVRGDLLFGPECNGLCIVDQRDGSLISAEVNCPLHAKRGRA